MVSVWNCFVICKVTASILTGISQDLYGDSLDILRDLVTRRSSCGSHRNSRRQAQRR